MNDSTEKRAGFNPPPPSDARRPAPPGGSQGPAQDLERRLLEIERQLRDQKTTAEQALVQSARAIRLADQILGHSARAIGLCEQLTRAPRRKSPRAKAIEDLIIAGELMRDAICGSFPVSTDCPICALHVDPVNAGQASGAWELAIATFRQLEK